MSMARIGFAVVISGGILGCLLTSTPSQVSRGPLDASRHNEDAVLTYLRPILNSAGKVARIYYEGSCSTERGGRVLFPALRVQAPSKGQIGLAAVRALFLSDKDVIVTDGRSGIIRIRIGNVSTGILETRLSVLSLSEQERYNPAGPEGVISAIERTSDMQAAMSRLGVSQSPVFYIGPAVPSAARFPHLPAELKNVTVEQVLDSIARTFGGTVIYGECAKPDGKGLFDIEFDWLHSH